MSACSLDCDEFYQSLIDSPQNGGYEQCLYNILITIDVKILPSLLLLLCTAEWTQLISYPEPPGGCNAIIIELNVLVTFCPIRGVVEGASIPLRRVFLLSAIIVLFAGWLGKGLREKFSL